MNQHIGVNSRLRARGLMARWLDIVFVLLILVMPAFAQGKKTPENPAILLLGAGPAVSLWRYLKSKIHR